jgi:hypothetical protein
LSQDRGGFIESNGAFFPSPLNATVTVSQPWPRLNGWSAPWLSDPGKSSPVTAADTV